MASISERNSERTSRRARLASDGSFSQAASAAWEKKICILRKKCLTKHPARAIVNEHSGVQRLGNAGVAELADAWDLKSHGSNPVPVRSRSPAPYRGVEQLVARRAHNPEAAGSSPVSATMTKPFSVRKTGKGFVLFCFKERKRAFCVVIAGFLLQSGFGMLYNKIIDDLE